MPNSPPGRRSFICGATFIGKLPTLLERDERDERDARFGVSRSASNEFDNVGERVDVESRRFAEGGPRAAQV